MFLYLVNYVASNQSRLSIRQKNDRQTCSSLIYDLRPRSTASLHTHCVCQAIASLTYVLRTRHPCLFSNEIHFVQLTFLQQLRKVSKRSRSPTNFLIHIFIRLQCHSGERKHPCKALRLVQTSMSGHLTSQLKRWKIGVVNQSSDFVAKKTAFSSAHLKCIIMGVLLTPWCLVNSLATTSLRKRRFKVRI